MTRWVVLILMFACAIAAAQAQSLDPTVVPPRITGWLHTSGTQILEESNKPVRLCGIGGSMGTAMKAQASNISDWGFNAVRIPIMWGSLEPTAPTKNADGTLTHHWDAGYLSKLDSVMAEYGKRGIGVVLVMSHGRWFVGKGDDTFPAWLYKSGPGGNRFRNEFFANIGGAQVKPLDGFTEAWKCIAERYADNPTLAGIDILDKPGYQQGDNLDALYAKVAEGIRSVNRRVLIIFEDVRTNRNPTVLQDPPTVTNAVYSVHLYADDWTHDGKTWMDMVRKRAEEWKVPIYVGEFNAFDGGLNVQNPKTRPADWRAQTKAFLDYCREHGISWSFAQYEGPAPAFSSIVVPDTGKPKEDLVKLLQSGF